MNKLFLLVAVVMLLVLVLLTGCAPKELPPGYVIMCDGFGRYRVQIRETYRTDKMFGSYHEASRVAWSIYRDEARIIGTLEQREQATWHPCEGGRP